MSEIIINHTTLVYEIMGQGLPVAFTPAGFWSLDRARPVAERLSEAGYRVLFYDRPNCGASGIAIYESSSEVMVWAEYLHALLQHFGMTPAYVGGGSAGALVSLLVGHRYPEAVKGLLLISPPTGDPELWESAGERYRESIKIAEQQGMQALTEILPWSELIEQNPANRNRLLAMNPAEFTNVMRRWNAWIMSGRAHVAGLTDEQLGAITAPAIIVSGSGGHHPQQAAEDLHGLLLHSELILPAEYFPPDELDELFKRMEQHSGQEYDAAMTPILDQFIRRVEASD